MGAYTALGLFLCCHRSILLWSLFTADNLCDNYSHDVIPLTIYRGLLDGESFPRLPQLAKADKVTFFSLSAHPGCRSGYIGNSARLSLATCIWVVISYHLIEISPVSSLPRTFARTTSWRHLVAFWLETRVNFMCWPSWTSCRQDNGSPASVSPRRNINHWKDKQAPSCWLLILMRASLNPTLINWIR